MEAFRALTRSYYRRTDGVILVYDITSRQSFDELTFWWKDVKERAPEDVCGLLVGNKADLEHERAVKWEEGWAFAHQEGISFLEISATKFFEAEFVFRTIAVDLKKRSRPTQSTLKERPKSNAISGKRSSCGS
jgi:small GTP-binding protein